MSGLDVDSRQIRKAPADAVRTLGRGARRDVPADLDEMVERIARAGSTPLVVADGPEILGSSN